MKCKKDKFYDLLEDYFNSYLPVAKGLSDATITSYKATFRLLIEYIFTVKNIYSEEISFSVLTTECIQGFLEWLETARKCSVSTRNQRLSAIAAFAQYAQSRDFGSASLFRNSMSLIPKKKCPRNSRSYFTRDEVKILFKIPNSRTEIGLRDKTMLCFMYASGMRAQEVCNMTVGDIQFYSDRASIRVLGKGQKMRRIGIPMQAAEILKKYIMHRNIMEQKERHVFSSQTHEKMTVSCVEEIYYKCVKKARSENPGMFRDNYSPHSMRHTTATHMLEAGVPLIVVKNFLGHVSLQTTQIYAEVTQDTMNHQLKAWNDKWFLNEKNDDGIGAAKRKIPEFLM